VTNAILSKDFTIEFFKDEEWKFFGCATDLQFGKSVEPKETKTLGDGKNKDYEGQSISRTINISGVTTIDESEFTHFDLDEYCEQMVKVPFRIIAEAPDGQLEVTIGLALIVENNMSGGADGHATGDCTLLVCGPIVRTNSLSTCDLSIDAFATSFYAPGEGFNRYRVDVTLGGSDTWLRYEFSIDGGGWLVGIGGDSTFFYIDIAAGTYDITVRPICESGVEGTESTQEETLS